MNARAVAIDVLARVEATDAYLNVVLDQRLAEAPLKDPRDAGLVTELSYGATRRRLSLDRVIASFSDRRLAALEERVLAASIVSTVARPYLRSQRSTSQRGWLSRTERCSARSDSGGSGMDSTAATLRSTAFTKPEARERPICFSPSTVSDTAARRGTREKKIW